MKGRTASWSDLSGRLDRTLIKVYTSLAVCLTLPLLAPLAGAQGTFLTFDTLQGRPIAISPDGTRLFAVDTPDNGRF